MSWRLFSRSIPFLIRKLPYARIIHHLFSLQELSLQTFHRRNPVPLWPGDPGSLPLSAFINQHVLFYRHFHEIVHHICASLMHPFKSSICPEVNLLQHTYTGLRPLEVVLLFCIVSVVRTTHQFHVDYTPYLSARKAKSRLNQKFKRLLALAATPLLITFFMSRCASSFCFTIR